MLRQMEMSKRWGKEAFGGVSIGYSATKQQTRQRMEGAPAGGIESAIQYAGGNRQVAEACGQGLHLHRIFSSQFPAHR